MTVDEAMAYELRVQPWLRTEAEKAHEVLKAEVLRLRSVTWQIEDLCWDKLAADGEHGDEPLERRLTLNLFSVMVRLDPDGSIFQKPYKIQPKMLEIERLRAENDELKEQLAFWTSEAECPTCGDESMALFMTFVIGGALGGIVAEMDDP